MKTVPAVYTDLPEEQESVLHLALNRISGDWQEDQLAALLQRIQSRTDLTLTGFAAKEVDRLLHHINFSSRSDEDVFRVEQALIDKPTLTQPGEIVELGSHRLACGDARDQELLNRLMDEPADLVFTDPPYNVDYQSGRLGGILNDLQAPEDFQQLIEAAFQNTFAHVRAGGAFYICMGWSGYSGLLTALRPNKVHLANVIIWVKNNATMGWQDYRYKHELIVRGQVEDDRSNALAYGWKAGQHYFAPIRDEADVWYIRKRNSRDYVHPTQKPLALITRAILNSSRSGEVVLDPFGGSGSTLIAAEATTRRARLVELDPRFCDVIRNRYAHYIQQHS